MKRYDNIALCLYGTIDQIRGEIKLPQSIDGMKMTTFAHIVTNNPIESIGSTASTIDHCTWSVGTKSKKYHMSDIIYHGNGMIDSHSHPHVNHLRSMYLSVLNKKSYEVEKNQRFDLVMVKSVSDLETIGWKMYSMLVQRNSVEWGGIIRSATKKDYQCNGFWSMDDSLFVGRSADIDTISRISLAYEDGTIWKMTDTTELDPAYRTADRGSLLWKWASIRNLMISNA